MVAVPWRMTARTRGFYWLERRRAVDGGNRLTTGWAMPNRWPVRESGELGPGWAGRDQCVGGGRSGRDPAAGETWHGRY
jgi:hypothetical protein